MSKTSIAWTNRTWNPVTGCTKYSAGCQHCYAEVMAKRLKGMGQKRYANAFELTLHPEALKEPKKVKEPSMFFVCSMSDLFHKNVPDEFIDKVIQVIKDCPQHTFQLLTKRTERMHDYFTYGRHPVPSNCWIGTTVENQLAVRRIPWLAEIKNAPVRFLSCEPLLSDLKDLDLFNIDWVIVGGESGNQARPMQKEWVLNIKRQCNEQGVPFFFKQWGTFGEDGIRRSKEANGYTIDGEAYREWPKEWTAKVDIRAFYEAVKEGAAQ